MLPLSVGGANEFLRMNEGVYDDECWSDARRSRRVADDSSTEEVVGLMEPRPREVVGWGIGEVLEGGGRL